MPRSTTHHSLTHHSPLTLTCLHFHLGPRLTFDAHSGNDFGSRGQFTGHNLRVLIVVDTDDDFDGLEKVAVGDPDVAMRAATVGGRFLPGRRRRLDRLLVF